MAEPEGGDDAGAYSTPAHSIPMVSGGHGSIREPEEKSGNPGIPIVPIDAEKSSERSREPIISPDLIAKAEAADARLLGSRRSSRTPSIERPDTAPWGFFTSKGDFVGTQAYSLWIVLKRIQT